MSEKKKNNNNNIPLGYVAIYVAIFAALTIVAQPHNTAYKWLMGPIICVLILVSALIACKAFMDERALANNIAEKTQFGKNAMSAGAVSALSAAAAIYLTYRHFTGMGAPALLLKGRAGGLIFSVVFIIAGGFVLASALKRTAKIRRCSYTAEADVIGVHDYFTQTHDSGGHHDTRNIMLTLHYAYDGVEYKTDILQIAFAIGGKTPGDKVIIKLNPDNPNEICGTVMTAYWGMTNYIMAIGFIGLGAYIFYRVLATL
jgi:hypothetical protein